jgi:hypothetical protein
MANRQAGNNGIATRFQSGKEAAKAGHAGGVASGESKRKWATLREAFKELMTDGDRQRIFDAMRERAAAGDVRAAEFLRDTMGEKPTVSIEQTEPTEITFRVIDCTPEEADAISG